MHISRVACALAVLLPLAASAQPQTDNSSRQSRGQILYDTFCIHCHNTQIHWRDAGAVRDWASLRDEVARWQSQTGHNWSDAEIDDVSRYLSDSLYHFGNPEGRGDEPRR